MIKSIIKEDRTAYIEAELRVGITDLKGFFTVMNALVLELRTVMWIF